MSTILPVSLFTPASVTNASTSKKDAQAQQGIKQLEEALFTKPNKDATGVTGTKSSSGSENNQTRNSVEGRVTLPETQVTAQSLGNGQTEESIAGATDAESAEDAFLNFAHKSTEEKYMDMVLKSMGLTKEDLDKMAPEEREKILAKIQEKVKQDVEKTTGISTSSETGTGAAGSPV